MYGLLQAQPGRLRALRRRTLGRALGGQAATTPATLRSGGPRLYRSIAAPHGVTGIRPRYTYKDTRKDTSKDTRLLGVGSSALILIEAPSSAYHRGMLRAAQTLVTNKEVTSRRFYTQQHPFYCGIDLHARTMDLCILDQAGETRLHRN